MQYDPNADEYTCPNGKKLKYIYTNSRKTDTDYQRDEKVYQCESCEGCPFRNQCHRSNENRKIKVSHKLREYNQKVYDLITTDEGVDLRRNRSIQVEGAFGVIKQDFGFKRFLTRGKRKTETQFFLLSFAFNIEKLCNRINSGRFGTSLFQMDAA